MDFQYAKLEEETKQVLDSFLVYSRLKGYEVDYCVYCESQMKEFYDTIIIQKLNNVSPIILLLFDGSDKFNLEINHRKRKVFHISKIKDALSQVVSELEKEI